MVSGLSGLSGLSGIVPGGVATVAYVATKLPNVPSSRRSAIVTAAIAAANGKSFTSAQVIDALASLDHWWSFEAAACWQDTAGTTPAATSNPVGRVDDWTGTATLTQSGSSFKPTLTVAGISPDGVDDLLANASYGYVSGTPLFFLMLEKNLNGGIGAAPFSFGSTSTKLSGIVMQSNSGMQPAQPNGTYPYNSASPRIWSYQQSNASNNSLWLNNVSISTNTAYDAAGIYSAPFEVGRRNVGAVYSSGNIYTIAIKAATVSTIDRQKLERFFDKYWSTSLIP